MKDKKLAKALLTAEEELGIDNAEMKAEVGNPPSGEKDLDAEGKRAAEFEKLISGEFKKEFNERVKKIVSRRLKEVKRVKEKDERNSQIIEKLMSYYNISDNDPDQLERMINKDMENKKSITPNESERLIRRLFAENMLLRKRRGEEEKMRVLKERAQKLKSEAEETKNAYPDFDFEKELKNERFAELLRKGVNMKNAYEALNIDAILESRDKNTQKEIVDSIREKSARPVENGSDSLGGIVFEKNVSRLTKKEREKLAKRAAMGETIRF